MTVYPSSSTEPYSLGLKNEFIASENSNYVSCNEMIKQSFYYRGNVDGYKCTNCGSLKSKIEYHQVMWKCKEKSLHHLNGKSLLYHFPLVTSSQDTRFSHYKTCITDPIIAIQECCLVLQVEAVCYCEGYDLDRSNFTNSGHYTTLIYSQEDNCYYKINNAKEIKKYQVIPPIFEDNPNMCPYIIMYKCKYVPDHENFQSVVSSMRSKNFNKTLSNHEVDTLSSSVPKEDQQFSKNKVQEKIKNNQFQKTTTMLEQEDNESHLNLFNITSDEYLSVKEFLKDYQLSDHNDGILVINSTLGGIFHQQDIFCMQPGQWYNDEIISCIFDILNVFNFHHGNYAMHMQSLFEYKANDQTLSESERMNKYLF